jgi:hypothetical protein
METPFEDEDDDEYENDIELFDDPGGQSAFGLKRASKSG